MGEWTRERQKDGVRRWAIQPGGARPSHADVIDMLAEIDRAWSEIERLTQERDAVIAAGADERAALGAAVVDRARLMREPMGEEWAREVARGIVPKWAAGPEALERAITEVLLSAARGGESKVAVPADAWAKITNAVDMWRGKAFCRGDFIGEVCAAVDAARGGDVQHPDRERLGRIVREVWVEWAREQPSPKPSWLVPWEGLSEPDKEVDRRIGERLFAEGRRGGDVPAGEDEPLYIEPGQPGCDRGPEPGEPVRLPDGRVVPYEEDIDARAMAARAAYLEHVEREWEEQPESSRERWRNVVRAVDATRPLAPADEDERARMIQALLDLNHAARHLAEDAGEETPVCDACGEPRRDGDGNPIARQVTVGPEDFDRLCAALDAIDPDEGHDASTYERLRARLAVPAEEGRAYLDGRRAADDAFDKIRAELGHLYPGKGPYPMLEAARAEIERLRATPAPLTEEEARVWANKVRHDAEAANVTHYHATVAALLSASRGDIPAEVRRPGAADQTIARALAAGQRGPTNNDGANAHWRESTFREPAIERAVERVTGGLDWPYSKETEADAIEHVEKGGAQ